MPPEYTSIPVTNGLCILSGYGVKVTVWNGFLALEDGVADKRRKDTFHRATCGIKRLVVISSSGYLTFDALQWLSDIGAGVLVIGLNNDVLIANAPRGMEHPALRRAQAVAPFTPVGLQVTKFLLVEKITFQAGLMHEHGFSADALLDTLPLLEAGKDLEDLRPVEATAATFYWQSWRDVTVTFRRKDLISIPEHWLTFGSRYSTVTGKTHNASNPANSILNYAYGILEGETRIALLSHGLDPGLGILHTDQQYKASMAFDVMEPARPVVDEWLFDFLSRRVFSKNEFWENTQGVVRLTLDLRREIMLFAPVFAHAIAPYVEQVAELLLGQELPAKLTWKRKRKGRRKPPPFVPVEAHCLDCGVRIPDGKVYCKTCAEKRPAFVIKRKKAQTQRQQLALNAAVDAERLRTEYHWPEIFAAIQTIPIKVLCHETGLSTAYVSLVRQGRRVPHPRHWPAFHRAGQLGLD